MKKIFVILFMTIFAFSAAAAAAQADEKCTDEMLCNKTATFECQEFYNDSKYYTIAKWNADDNSFVLEQNARFRYYDTNVISSEKTKWQSNLNIDSIVATIDGQKQAFTGGREGVIDTDGEVEQLLFCGYRSKTSGFSGSGDMGSSSGVPEFPALTAVAAVIVVTLGIVFLRKN